ncbi:hypothetical protein [Verrucomicrobium sp. BvORR034]|uniref:hypothetical protein n=1 Tax=Verrucomicrobium sp. BvORR034 TaxID=1396418 RepID=UPI00067951E9|nr:hypothetical protein [Verrucomicrobium sp. BvORR034]
MSILLGIPDRDHRNFEQVCKSKIEERLIDSSSLTKVAMKGLRGITKNPIPIRSEQFKDGDQKLRETAASASPFRITRRLAEAVSAGGFVTERQLAAILQIGVDHAGAIIRALCKHGSLRKRGRLPNGDTKYEYTGKGFQLPPSDSVLRELVFRIGNQIVNATPRNSGFFVEAAFDQNERVDFCNYLRRSTALSLQPVHEGMSEHNYGCLALVAPWEQGDPAELAVSNAMRNYQSPGCAVMRLALASVSEEGWDRATNDLIPSMRHALVEQAAASCSKKKTSRNRYLIALLHAPVLLQKAS